MNDAITRRQVMDRAGNRIEPPPMATYCCEPSQRAVIRARDAQAGQRLDRTRNEAMALLRQLEPEDWLPQPLQLQQPIQPPIQPPGIDRALNAEFISGLIAGLAFSGLVATALILGDRL